MGELEPIQPDGDRFFFLYIKVYVSGKRHSSPSPFISNNFPFKGDIAHSLILSLGN